MKIQIIHKNYPQLLDNYQLKFPIDLEIFVVVKLYFIINCWKYTKFIDNVEFIGYHLIINRNNLNSQKIARGINMIANIKETVSSFVEDTTRKLSLAQYVNGVIEEVKKRNKGDEEFHQAYS